MSLRQVLFCDIEHVINYRDKIIKTTNEKLKNLWKNGDGIDFLKQVKFKKCGYDPIVEEPTNFIEQANQTLTYLVCLEAVIILLSKFPTKRFYVNFGTEGGYDVISEDESIICECFAVTTPESNDKLKLDTKKVYENSTAEWKYIIFYSANQSPIHVKNIRNKYKGVEIIALDSL